MTPQDRRLSVGEVGWSTGFWPWSEAVEVEGLSAHIVHWWLWAVWLTGKAWLVKMMAKRMFVVENTDMSWWMMKTQEEPKEKERVSVGTC